MAQEYKNIAIIGAGASGCVCAYYLLKSCLDVTLFDIKEPLLTLLPTGGGRCNLAFAEFDFKELVKNYPRGEKFLYSVFSRFSAGDTIELFKELGVETYIQDDGRIFPKSNSAKEVREKLLKSINKAEFIKEKVLDVIPPGSGFKVITNKAEYFFSHVVISIGGGRFFSSLKHHIVPYKPALTGLKTDITYPAGIVIKNAYSTQYKISGNILFTHSGISGPLVYKISSINAYKEFPYDLNFNLLPQNNLPLQQLLDANPHKEIKNILAKYLPLNFIKVLLGELSEEKAHKINGKTRDYISDKIHNFKITATGTNKGEETVTAGGIDLNEINSKNMESKLYPHLYFTGETLNIDGFCGGFNLQNAWSTAFIAAESIIQE